MLIFDTICIELGIFSSKISIIFEEVSQILLLKTRPSPMDLCEAPFF